MVHCGLEPAYLRDGREPAHQRRDGSFASDVSCEQKGQLLLVEAAQRLAAQGMEFELVLAGDGELRADIEALVKRS